MENRNRSCLLVLWGCFCNKQNENYIPTFRFKNSNGSETRIQLCTFKYSIQRGYSRNYRKLEIKKNLLLLSIFLRVYIESNPRF